MTNHFYIHIPFCNQKCPYCKFALTPIFDEFKKRRYIEYLKKEIREYFSVPISVCEFGESISEDFYEIKAMNSGGLGRGAVGVGGKMEIGGAKLPSFSLPNSFGTFSTKSTENGVGKIDEDTEINSEGQRTIYFGGGTPSILSLEEVREILECFPFYGNIETEITLESNPEDITSEYVGGLIELGINRLSIGIQTLNDSTLTEIHRSNKESIILALSEIEKALVSKGTISINIDFILGLPYTQSGETLHGIQKLHKQFPFITHTSVYMLEDEDYPKYWRKNSITENELQNEFIAILDYFESIGWNHYELSNFSKKGFESIHNQAYWDHSNSRGFGLSSASYEDGIRWNNSSSFSSYYQGTVENKEILSEDQIKLENMMFELRTSGWKNEGIIQNENIIDELISENMIEMENNRIKPTKTGIFVLDHIMSKLIK